MTVTMPPLPPHVRQDNPTRQQGWFSRIEDHNVTDHEDGPSYHLDTLLAPDWEPYYAAFRWDSLAPDEREGNAPTVGEHLWIWTWTDNPTGAEPVDRVYVQAVNRTPAQNAALRDAVRNYCEMVLRDLGQHDDTKAEEPSDTPP